MMHLNTIKKNAIKHFTEENFKESVNKSFADSISAINANIDYLIDKLVFITFTEIRKVLVPKLFKLFHQESLGGRKPSGDALCNH